MNNNMRLFKTLLCLSLAFCAGGCISVNLSPSKAEKSSKVSVVDPSPSFVRFESPGTDRAWRHSQTGNTISYVSECSDASELSLIDIRKGIVTGINELVIEQETELTYNGRSALQSVAKGRVEGTETKLDILVFKKDGCLYILTYVGLPNVFDQQHDDFEQFLTGFRVP